MYYKESDEVVVTFKAVVQRFGAVVFAANRATTQAPVSKLQHCKMYLSLILS